MRHTATAACQNSGLRTWVSKQRTLKRRLDRGEPSEGMTAERAARLTALGFGWGGLEVGWEAQLRPPCNSS